MLSVPGGSEDHWTEKKPPRLFRLPLLGKYGELRAALTSQCGSLSWKHLGNRKPVCRCVVINATGRGRICRERRAHAAGVANINPVFPLSQNKSFVPRYVFPSENPRFAISICWAPFYISSYTELTWSWAFKSVVGILTRVVASLSLFLFCNKELKSNPSGEHLYKVCIPDTRKASTHLSWNPGPSVINCVTSNESVKRKWGCLHLSVAVSMKLDDTSKIRILVCRAWFRKCGSRGKSWLRGR